VACRPANETQDCTTPTAPICDPSAHTCRACNSHGECPSLGAWPNLEATGGVCTSNGSCADISKVEFVDDRNLAPGICITNNIMRTGVVAHPYCDLVETLPSPSPYVLVHGSTQSYSSISFPSISNLTTALIGPGLKAATPAVIAASAINAPTVNISGDGVHAIDITIDGFVIQGAGGTVDANGIDCTGTSPNFTALHLVRSIIQANAQLGIKATSCNVTVDETIIGPTASGTKNSLGGISLASCSYTITNTLIHHNGDATLASKALSLTGSGSTMNMIVNCTIADNASDGSVPAGVACGETAQPTMFNVALNGNTMADQTLCTSAMTSAFSGATGSNKNTTGCASADLFVAPTAVGSYNYAPRPSPGGACTVTLTNAGNATGAPTVDLYASPRPSPAGTKPDIGAIEGP
jgi:hypothetical protein